VSTEKQQIQLKENLAALGFEVLDDSRKKLIEKIKNIIINQIHYSDADEKHNFSGILLESCIKIILISVIYFLKWKVLLLKNI